MRTTSFSPTVAAWLLALVSGCGEPTPDDAFSLGGNRYPLQGLTQWALPESLTEVSGLALTPDGRLFAHADEGRGRRGRLSVYTPVP